MLMTEPMNTLFPVVIFWYIKLLNMMNDKINDVLMGGGGVWGVTPT